MEKLHLDKTADWFEHNGFKKILIKGSKNGKENTCGGRRA